jgi:hypothetical protein
MRSLSATPDIEPTTCCHSVHVPTVSINHAHIGKKFRRLSVTSSNWSQKMAIGIVMSVRLSLCLSPEMEERDSYQNDILLMSCCGILIKLSLRFLWGMSWGQGKRWLRVYKHDTYDLLRTWIAIFEVSARNTISCWIGNVTKKVHNWSLTATLYSFSPTCLGPCSRIYGDHIECYSEFVMSCTNVQHHFNIIIQHALSMFFI